MSDETRFVEIDQDRLDEEWVRQPKIFYKYATELAKAKEELDRAKAKLDVIKAGLDQEIRTNPSDFDIKKLSEKAVEGAIMLSPYYEKGIKVVNNCKYNVAILQAAVDALDHRKKALESLVYLHGQNYFSTPKAPENMRDTVSEYEKRSVRSKGTHKERS